MIFTPWHARLFKRLAVLLIPYSLLRLGFYFYHLDIYKDFAKIEILLSFVLGLRFDVAAICLLNISIAVMALIPSSAQRFITLERVTFTLINALGFIMTLNDYELFLFMGKRLSSDIFAVTGDIVDQLPQVANYYWYFPILAVALGISVYVVDKKIFKISVEKTKPLQHWLGGFLVLALLFIGIRGGLQYKSINVQSAFVQGKNELGHLVLNSPYHFLRTLKNKRVERVRFFKNDLEAKKLIVNSRSFEAGFRSPSRYNVVLLILESFSLEYVEQGYAPFLSSLSRVSVSLDRHLANGRRSIEVLPSVLCGLPSLIDDPISKSAFSGNRFACFPEILKKAGYQNFFFHGGSKGTMGFESYTLSHGFDRYFSREEHPRKDDYDGHWGIYDEPYLKFAASKISEMRHPFLAGIFTLSSHQPYSVPEKYKGKFNKGTLEIHESIGYADFAVKEFFHSIEDQPWFKKTIFIITSDHTQKRETKKYQNVVGAFRVPMLIYAPGLVLPKVDKVTQHSDIPWTVLDMVGLDPKGLPLIGNSIFSKDEGRALNFADGRSYILVSDNGVTKIDKSQVGEAYQINWSTGELTPSEGKDLNLLKAHVQYFINGLIDNNLSP
jgi:phosphoglycerol transferase MdoB-like AlkP superfamily enzyme